GQANSPDFRTPPSHFESPDQLVEGARAKSVIPLRSVDGDPGQATVDLVGNVGELGHRLPLLIESPEAMPLWSYHITKAMRGDLHSMLRPDSYRHEVPAHFRQFTDRPLQVVELGDQGCPTIRDVG